MSHEPHAAGHETPREVSMRAAILTVSTSVAQGRNEDRSGRALVAAAAAAGADVVATDVVADDGGAIETWLRARVTEGIELIFTTGGTGFTLDDVTPEATARVIERVAPGIAEAMRAESLKYTLKSMLSRGMAGTAGTSLIVNFPGSPSSIDELFPVISPILGHAVATLHRQDGHTPDHG